MKAKRKANGTYETKRSTKFTNLLFTDTNSATRANLLLLPFRSPEKQIEEIQLLLLFAIAFLFHILNKVVQFGTDGMAKIGDEQGCGSKRQVRFQRCGSLSHRLHQPPWQCRLQGRQEVGRPR